jgi:small subunit ribosomal protein S21
LLQVLVKNNDIEGAIRTLKKKLQYEGVFKSLKNGRFFEKPSEKKARRTQEARRRKRKIQYKFDVVL